MEGMQNIRKRASYEKMVKYTVMYGSATWSLGGQKKRKIVVFEIAGLTNIHRKSE